MDDMYSKTVQSGGKRIYLVKVARAQRMLILLVLGALCAYGLLMSMRMVSPQLASGPGALVVFTIIALLYLGICIAAVVQTVRLSIASGGNVVLAVVMGVFMIVPCLGLLLMLVANQRATTLLKQAGVNVGFMGVAADEMGKLIEGACAKCGYDLRGLAGGVCPECGAPLTPPMAA